MSDIVERLRKGDVYGDCKRDRYMCDVMDESADEIERLRDENREHLLTIEFLRSEVGKLQKAFASRATAELRPIAAKG